MDAAQLDAMDPDARMNFLGNSLYPNVAALTGEALAGKITGMLLELPNVEVLPLLTTPQALKDAVGAAIDALPAEMLDMLGESKPEYEAAAASPEPVISPASIMAHNVSGSPGWADADDDEEMPCVGDLFAADAARRAAKSRQGHDDESACPMNDDDDGFVCEWNAAEWALEPDIVKLCTFIAERLEEPQVRIVRAVVETLGPHAALALLHRTELCMHRGGMIVEETGKPRTKGGIYVKLLKDAPDMPAEGRAQTLQRIKKEGDDVKKARAKALAEKRARAAGKPPSPTKASLAGATAATDSPSSQRERPKASLADFMTPGLARVC